MAKNNLIKTADIQVTPREVDFVTRFERNWEPFERDSWYHAPDQETAEHKAEK